MEFKLAYSRESEKKQALFTLSDPPFLHSLDTGAPGSQTRYVKLKDENMLLSDNS